MEFNFQSIVWKNCETVLADLYGQPKRFYHNLTHICDCLEQLQTVSDSMRENREAIKLALWFHDAIYDTTRSDNESASAELAGEWLSKMEVSSEKIDCVTRLIQITDHHSIPETPDEILIVDIDLSILGRDTETYTRYAEAIRQEYEHVQDEEYRAGRKAVLEGFLKRKTIFGNAIFREKYEEAARRNLATEISELGIKTSSIQPPNLN